MPKWMSVIVAAVCIGRVQAADPGSPAATSEAPGGPLFIENDQWEGLSDEPGRHMGQARESYLEIDARTAAAELRKAAAQLRLAASEVAAASRNSLIRSALELEALARRTEEGTVKSVREFDVAFARASHALARHHFIAAERAWAARETQKAGQRLRAASDNLGKATVWSGRKLQAGTTEVIKDTRIISGKLIEGTGFMFDEIGRGMTSFGKQVEVVGHGIEPHAPPAPE